MKLARVLLTWLRIGVRIDLALDGLGAPLTQTFIVATLRYAVCDFALRPIHGLRRTSPIPFTILQRGSP